MSTTGGPPSKGPKTGDVKRRANTSSNSSRSDSNARKAKLVQKLCVHLNGDVKDEFSKDLYFQAINALNLRRADKTVLQGEELYRDRLRRQVSKLGAKGDVSKLDAAMLALKASSEPNKIPKFLHFLSVLAFPDGNPAPLPQQQQQQQQQAGTSKSKPQPLNPDSAASLASIVLSMAAALNPSNSNTSHSATSTSVSATSNSVSGTSNTASATSVEPFEACSGTMVDEATLVQDLIYNFQGVEGHVLKFNPVAQVYQFDLKAVIPTRLKLATLHQSQLSLTLRDVVAASKAGEGGVVSQALAAAFRSELTEFYRLVASCQDELKSPSGLSLRQLALRVLDPTERMNWLASVAKATANLRGGAILSSVHGFLQHGSEEGRATTMTLLSAASLPVLHMLTRWLLDGELSDPSQEFFIAGNEDVSGDRLWHEKYRVQESMVPSFIPMELADKILATGKSINFLREVCRDRVDLQGRAALKTALSNTPVEALFSWDSGAGADLLGMMESAFRETSARVITVLTQEYQLTCHLQAMRDFLLLGQGDFIGHLMELLEPELVRPASDVLPHNVSALLDVAVRTTNAQFAAPDVLARLDVRILHASPGDFGWDVFSLDYHVNGPIGTVFTKDMVSYLVMFQALWKAKRIECVLSRMWKQQATGSRMLRKIPELAPVLRQIHLLTSEMIHFIHQLQYYVLFEVIECSWAELAVQIRDAQTLDEIIVAHHSFIKKIKAGALLEEDTVDLLVQLRGMFETVLQLQAQEDLLHTRALQELDNRARLNSLIEERARRGEFGLTSKEEAEFAEATQSFLGHVLSNVRFQVRSLAYSYQTCIRKLMQMLGETGLVSLQLLSFRLDFNEHYKHTGAPRK